MKLGKWYDLFYTEYVGHKEFPRKFSGFITSIEGTKITLQNKRGEQRTFDTRETWIGERG